MVNIYVKTLVILAHLDDEFAFSPIIKKIADENAENLKIIYCAERLDDNLELRKIRRDESIRSMALLGVDKKNIDYLNNYFLVDDLKLYNSANHIYSFLKELMKETNFKQILTLNFEGGNPDHDALALLVSKFSKNYSKISIFFPAYNSRNTFGFPLSVFKPLRKQEKFFSSFKLGFFSWIDTLKIAFIYKSEWKAFIKLFPFIFLNLIFSKNIYFAKKINLKSVNWSRSLSFIIYKCDLDTILHYMKRL